MRRGAPGTAALALLVAIAGSARADLRVTARLLPPTVHVGEPARYVGQVVFPRGALVTPRWLPPDTSASLTWGPLAATLSRAGNPADGDTLRVVTTVQSFALGLQRVPGLAFTDAASHASPQRLPMTALVVTPVIPAADTNADLHGIKGPLAAPWWERVPWRWVLLGLGVVAAIVWLVIALRRRPVAAPVVAAPRPDARARALERLAALRARRLPEQGAFGEHAFELTAILRRYLESVAGGLHPGDTTTELATRLADGALARAETQRLVALLRGWDRLKFARDPSSVADARQSEAAVEAFLRRPEPGGTVAAA